MYTYTHIMHMYNVYYTYTVIDLLLNVTMLNIIFKIELYGFE